MSGKKQNYYAFYVAIALVAAVLVYFSADHPIRKSNLYGIVESPKVRLNHPRKSVVELVNVAPGQKVEKGAVLMQLRSDAISDDLQKAAYREKQLLADREKEMFELEIQGNELALELVQHKRRWEQEKAELELARRRDDSWLQNFAGVTPPDTGRVLQWKIEMLDNEYKSRVAEIKLRQELLAKRKQLQESTFLSRKEALEVETANLKAEEASLVLRAPASGTVDNVYFMEGQTADGFSDLITLLPDENKYVRAYLTQQSAYTGDFSRVVVQSALDAGKTTSASYIGFGGVELLPLQIQEMAVQQSGKEIFFKLDTTEGWLQGEKVMILVP